MKHPKIKQAILVKLHDPCEKYKFTEVLVRDIKHKMAYTQYFHAEDYNALACGVLSGI